jgi:DNA-binding CsgD family transcriptional regulator
VHIQRRKGKPAFAPNDLSLLDTFRPHLARASLLAGRWRLERLRAAAEALALIGLPAAIIDADGKVLAANSLIEAMKSHIIWLPNDRIALSEHGAYALLQQAIADLRTPAASAVGSIPARGRLADDPVVVHMIPLTGRAREIFCGGFGVLLVTPVSAPAAPAIALVQGLFDLSPAEARVARGIAEGLTVDQIAVQQGLTSETIRTQVKRVFAKTAVNRQSQLAALLASVPTIPMG